MARMHSRARGKSISKRPIGRPVPEGFKGKPSDVEKKIIELAKEGKAASQIGLVLREEGILDVKAITGKKIAAILKEAEAAPELPEDLIALIKKAVLIRKHLEDNKQDQPAKRGLKLTESKVFRLAKYYKASGIIPQKWNYNPKELSYLAE